MNHLIAASLVLMAGGGICLLPLGNRVRAGAGIASQLVATVLVWMAVVPVLQGAVEPTTRMHWAYPMGELHFRLDALGAFFLSWSLPMTVSSSNCTSGARGRSPR